MSIKHDPTAVFACSFYAFIFVRIPNYKEAFSRNSFIKHIPCEFVNFIVVQNVMRLDAL